MRHKRKKPFPKQNPLLISEVLRAIAAYRIPSNRSLLQIETEAKAIMTNFNNRGRALRKGREVIERSSSKGIKS